MDYGRQSLGSAGFVVTQGASTFRRGALARALVIAVLLTLAATAWAQEVGTIAELDGSTQIGRGTEWMEASVGAAVHQGDQLRTGQPGRLRVVFQDDSVVTLSDNSQLTIDQQVFDPARGKARSLMGLVQGKVSALVSEYYHRAGTAYDIKTATAVAGVRGTDFVVQYDPRTDVTEVVGVSGHVEVRSALDPTSPGVIVTAKEVTSVARGRSPKPPKRLSDTNFRQYIEGIEFIGAGRLESQTLEHPVLAGASVPHPERAAAAPVPALAGAGGPGDVLHEPRDASSLIHQPPAAVESAAGRLRIGLF